MEITLGHTYRWHATTEMLLKIYRYYIYRYHLRNDIDCHESKPAMCILRIIEESQTTSIISYFATYSFYNQT